jgi:hypothetical protein
MQTSVTDIHDSPQFLTGTTRPPRDRRIAAKRRRAGCARRWREGVPAPDRCQAVGGARAANSARGGEGKSKASGGSLGTRTEMSGSGRDGGSASTKAPARWIRVQIEQWSSARSCRSVGSEGVPGAAFAPSAVTTVDLSADIGAARSRRTWPNVSTSWSASANSARYELHFDRDRNQSIVVALARLTPAADLFLRADAATIVTVLHYGNWPMPVARWRRSDSSRLLQKILSRERAHRRAPQPMRRASASSRGKRSGQRPSRIQVAARLPTRSRSPISPANTGNTPMPRTTLASRTRNPSQSSP